mmetsp:Transcript_7040/g.29016  ORF Transcript_7040/g.29016 Transcript_7040/m.29016 type:complete len:393 (+) Transcript_7040:157-1335(+)
MVTSIVQSCTSSRPFMPMEKLMILMSRDVGRDAKTPVTVRFSALLLSAPEAAPSFSAATTLTPFIASSKVVTSSSPFFFLPFSFSAFFAARFASISAFFAALRASFSSFSFCTCMMSAAASASSFAFFSAKRRPSSFASTSPAFSSAASSESTVAAASTTFLGFSSTSSSSNPAGTTFFAVFLRLRFDPPAAAASSSPSSPSSFSFLRRTRTTLGSPSSPVSPVSSSELEYSELTYPSGLFAFSSSVEMPQSSSSSPYVKPDDFAFSSASAASAAMRFSSSSSASLRRRRSSANSASSSAEPSSAPWLMSAASHSSLPVKMPFFWRSALAFSSRALRASTLSVFHFRNESRVTGVPGPCSLSFSSASRSSSWSDLRFMAASRIMATRSALNT